VLTGEFAIGAGCDRAPDRWIRWTTTGCVALLALIGSYELLMRQVRRKEPRHHRGFAPTGELQ
jgi:hypothetical protein